MKTSRKKLLQRLNELMDYAERLAGHELGLEPVKFEELSPQEVARTAQEVSQILKEQEASAKERAQACATLGSGDSSGTQPPG